MEIAVYKKAESLRLEINQAEETLNSLFNFKAAGMLSGPDCENMRIEVGRRPVIAYINDIEISSLIIHYTIELFQTRVKELQKTI